MIRFIVSVRRSLLVAVALGAAGSLSACSLSDPPKKRPSTSTQEAAAGERPSEAPAAQPVQPAAAVQPVEAPTAAVRATPSPAGQIRGAREIKRRPDLKLAPVQLQPRIALPRIALPKNDVRKLQGADGEPTPAAAGAATGGTENREPSTATETAE